MTHSDAVADRTLVRYLLALLPDREAERLDELAIADDAMAERLRGVENDLVDDYVRGHLAADLVAPFEAYYLSSPRRRDRVAFARRFAAAIDVAPAPVASSAQPAALALHASAEPARSDRRDRVSRRVADVWSIAAAALLVFACSVMFIENARLRDRAVDAERRVAAMTEDANRLNADALREQAAARQLSEELDRVRTAPQPAPMALVLLPQTRSGGALPPIAAISRGASSASLDLVIDQGIEHADLQVALTDPGSNQVVWRSAVAPAAPAAAGAPMRVHVDVPRSVLRSQHYAIELSGRGAAGRRELVGTYAFEAELR
jgi:hypothetical protein